MAYPVVMTQCQEQPSPEDSESKIYYEPDAATLASFFTLGALAEKISNSSEVVEDYGEELYAPIWTALPQSGSTSLMNISHVDTIRGGRFHRQLRESIPDVPPYTEEPTVMTIMLSLGAIFALGISKIPAVNQRDSGYSQGIDEISFEQGPMVWYPPPGVDVANTTAFKFTLTDYGYGYGNRSTSIYLAMAVITTYCIITIIYLIYAIVTGSTSTAWNSGIELVMLALQSRKPGHLGHASVGINSVKTFGESVGIRVNADNQLELVFAHDSDLKKRGLSKIERNKEY
ncbi:unnamed protein product [Alternaria alternata]